MTKYEAALVAIDMLTARIHNQSIRYHPNHSVIAYLQGQLDKVTNVFTPNKGENENSSETDSD